MSSNLQATDTELSTVQNAIAAIRNGGFAIVMDNEDRENEGDLIAAAEFATEKSLAFMIRHTTGIVCVPMLSDRVRDLQLPLMVDENTEPHRCKFTVTVDLRKGNSSGVSAADRARTICALADTMIKENAFTRPGHIFPLKAMEGGVLARAGHTEAAVDLVRLAGCSPVGYICEINDDDGKMLRRPQLQVFAKQHQIPLITISDLIRYRIQHESVIECAHSDTLNLMKTPFGEWRHLTFTSSVLKQTLDVLVYGEISNGTDIPVYIADCSNIATFVTMQWAQQYICTKHGSGVVIYVTDTHLLSKISGQCMAQQSFFGLAVQALKALGVQSVQILVSDSFPFEMGGFGLTISGKVRLEG